MNTTNEITTRIRAIADLPDTQRQTFLLSLTTSQRQAIMWELDRLEFDDPLADLGWEEWNQQIIGEWIKHPYSTEQQRFWEWSETIDDGPVDPFLAIWPREHGKSAGCEILAAKLGALRVRRFCLYVSDTQRLANSHIANLKTVCESRGMAAYYPGMAEVELNAAGHSKGWTQDMIRTAAGFGAIGVGLDVGVRGLRLDNLRPDLVVLDDYDDVTDGPGVVKKKIEIITQSIMGATGDNPVVISAQNLTHANSVLAQILDRRLDVFPTAVRSGPYPAVADMRVAKDGEGVWRVVDGEFTWVGFGREKVEEKIKIMTLPGFQRECQQDITEQKGALWAKALIDKHRLPYPPPELLRTAVGVDPNKTGRGDDAGVIVFAVKRHADGLLHGYVLDDRTDPDGPSKWRDVAAKAFLDWGAGTFVAESAGLGQWVEMGLRDSPLLRDQPVPVVDPSTRLGKGDRAKPVAQLYEDGRIHHCGHFPVLEGQMTSWVPAKSKFSPGAIDALVHVATYLMLSDESATFEHTADEFGTGESFIDEMGTF